MEIVNVEVVVVETPAKDRRAADQTHEAALILVTADDGTVGVGEAAAHPAVVKAFIDQKSSFSWDMGVADLLLGEDPRDPRRLWQKLYRGTFWSGRVGLGHIALAGVDIALWDLAGKLLKKPVWELLEGTAAKRPVPYLTTYHGPSALPISISNTTEVLDQAREMGYRAAKIEALVDTTADNDEIVELARAVRAHAGDDFILGLDVGYRWTSFEQAFDAVKRLEEFDLAFIETPFMPELLDDYRALVEATTIPIAGAEILTAHSEYAGLLGAGVQILQAGTCRLGITETDRLARTAASQGRQFIPYGYVSTLFPVLANIHIAAAHANVPLTEMAPPYFYPHMILRGALAGPEPVIHDGEFELPSAPGLGIELDLDAVKKFRVA